MTSRCLDNNAMVLKDGCTKYEQIRFKNIS